MPKITRSGTRTGRGLGKADSYPCCKDVKVAWSRYRVLGRGRKLLTVTMRIEARFSAVLALATALAAHAGEPIYAQMRSRYQEQESNEERKDRLCHRIYKDAQFSRYAGVKEWFRYYVEQTGNRNVWYVLANSGGGCSYARKGSLSMETVPNDSNGNYGHTHQWQIEGRELVRYRQYFTEGSSIDRLVMGTSRGNRSMQQETPGRREVTNYDTVFPNGVTNYRNIFN